MPKDILSEQRNDNSAPKDIFAHEASGGNAEKIKGTHPFLYSLAEKLAQHPKLDAAVQSAADSPIAEAALSAQPALINAFKNIGNLSPIKVNMEGAGLPTVESRSLSSPSLTEPTQRAFPEPKDLSGIIGSTVGKILGAGTAFVAAPGSTTIPGSLATGFAEGSGDTVDRSLDAVVGTLLPGILHGMKFGKSVLKSRDAGKNIKKLELDKANAENEVFTSKEDLADQVNKQLEPVTEKKNQLASSLDKLAGESESVSKNKVANATKKAEQSIENKYHGLYEGFNASKAGQTFVKEPVKIGSLEKEYGLKQNDFSSDTKGLIKKLIGSSKEIPESDTISVITGKPTNKAGTEIIDAATPKVADYINLWKQLRAEVAEHRYSMKSASTPESKAAFREKANALEKFSDDINKKAMGSLSEAEATKYADIQKGYLKERVPFLEEPLLKRATGKQPKIPDNFFNKLNESGFPDLIKTFKKSHPELVDAITSHDTRGLSALGHEDLNKLVNSDFGRFINTSTRNKLHSLKGHKEAEQLLSKALGKVQTSELGRKVKAADINDIIKQRPELGEPIKNVAQQQERVRLLKKALVDEGFKKRAIDDALSKYKTVKSVIKASGIPAATYGAIIKSKAAGSNETDS